MSAPQNADLEAKLEKLECHFTWGLQRDNIKDLDNIPEKLLDRVKFCHRRYHATYFNILAYVSQLEGNNEAALEFLGQAETILRGEDPFSEDSLLVTYANFAWVYYHIGNLTEVSNYLGKLESICKGIPRSAQYSAKVPVVYGEKGWAFLRLGAVFYQSSKESFQQALHEEPENVSFNIGYAVVLYRLEGLRGRKMNPESSAAVNQLRKVLQLEPSDSEAMVLLALKLQNVKKEDSLKLVTEALRLSPDVPQVTRYAAKYFRAAGSVDKSLEILKEAVKLAPHSSFLHHQIGLCYKQQLIDLFQVKKGSRRVPAGDKRALAAQCIYHFKKAVEMKPSNVHAQVNLAEAYGENRQLEDAEKIFSDLLGDGTLCDSDRQHCHANYGLFLMYKKKSELSAIRQFKIAYKMPVQTPARNLAGRKLKQIAERQLKSKDRVSEGFEMLAFVCTEDKQERKAMEYTMRAKQCDTPSVDSLSSAFTKTMKLE